MENVIVLQSLNGYLLKKLATRLRCTCKVAYSIINPKNYYPLFKQLYISDIFKWSPMYVKYDYKMVVLYNLQDFFKRKNICFLWIDRGPEYYIIQENFWDFHTGATLAYSMRSLEHIFTFGRCSFYFSELAKHTLRPHPI